MRFSQIAEGFQAFKVIDLPIANQPHGLRSDTPEQSAAREGAPVAQYRVGLRALTPGQREEVLCAAKDRAASRGVASDLHKNPIFDQALAVYTVAMACVDPDSDRGKPVLFFGDSLDGAAETIRSSPLMTDDIVYYLRERQEAWQDEINPQALTIKDSELYTTTQKAVEDADFLWQLRPGTLVSYTHSLACLCLSLLEANSTTSSDSASVSTEKSKPTAPATKPSKKASK